MISSRSLAASLLTAAASIVTTGVVVVSTLAGVASASPNPSCPKPVSGKGTSCPLPTPTRVLGQAPGASQGRAALERLGSQLTATAGRHGMSASKMALELLDDRSMWLDQDNSMFFVEQAPVVQAGATPQAATTAVDASGSLGTSTTTGDPFALHSRPGSALTIYLDFDGHTTTGTSWNSSYGTSIVSAPFSLDTDPTTFSTSEAAAMRTIWQRVSEDYAPFQVDVTTQDPGVEALRKANAGDQQWGVRVVVSPTNWYSTGAGGVAYLGSFAWNTDTPAFVFTAQLASSATYISEAIAHEVGHSVGLHHDGNSTQGYDTGHGDWAPIMGASYSHSVTQWSAGEYADANNMEDDLKIMSSFLPVRADDQADTTAAALPLAGPTVSQLGIIGSRSDVDVFRLDLVPGALSLVVSPLLPRPDLDVQAQLLDGTGAVAATFDPAGATTTVKIDATVASAGSYYLRLDGVGSGDPLTTGYSDYGSIGQYQITGTMPVADTTSTTSTTIAPTTTVAATTSTTAAPTTTVAATTTTVAATTTTVAATTTTVGATPTTLAPTTTLAPPTTVAPPTTQAGKTARVASVTVRRGTTSGSAVATVVVLAADGTPIAGATVTGVWGGQARGTGSAVTAANGSGTTPQVTFRRSGSVSFKVSAVTLPAGYTWDGVMPTGTAKI